MSYLLHSAKDSLIWVCLVACDTLAGQELMPSGLLTELIGLNLKMQEGFLLPFPTKTSPSELRMR